jgi:hypothetical protein
MPSSSDVGTPSPRSSTLSKLKLEKSQTNTSTNSLNSTTSEDAASSQGLRASMDATFGKMRDRKRRKSTDERQGSKDSGRRLSALIPGRRKRASRQDSEGMEKSVGKDSAIDSSGLPGNQSSSSLGMDESGRSSLFTDDNSDAEV